MTHRDAIELITELGNALRFDNIAGTAKKYKGRSRIRILAHGDLWQDHKDLNMGVPMTVAWIFRNFGAR